MANEKRLIDANARIEEIKKAHCTNCESYGGVRCRACWVDDAIGLIDDAPTVDAVEVVRCVMCRSLNMTGYDEDNAQITDPFLQSGFCEMWGKDTQLCNFCSYGERKDNG